MFKPIAIGVLIGILIGFLSPLNISLIDPKALMVVLLVCLDVLISSSNAKLLQQFNYLLFTNEFILNTIISLGIVYLANVMSLDLFSVIMLVLILKIFYNLNRLIKTVILKNQCSSEKGVS